MINPERHPLEELLNANSWEIMSAVQAGFRAIIDVKGKLAEYFMEKQLSAHCSAGLIESYVWQDIDGKPDFLIRYGQHELRMECKNIRSKELFARPLPGYKVEIQKTRNSKDGTPTRGYRFTEFDILATCLFNHTRRWEYLFIDVRKLEPRVGAADLVKIMQRVPFLPQGPWKADLIGVLKELEGTL